MKRLLFLLILLPAVLSAQTGDTSAPLRVSFLGDSYTTYMGAVAVDTFEVWYPRHEVNKNDRKKAVNDVQDIEQTWWRQLLKATGWTLDTNNSFSGATVCYTGYRKEDYTNRSFLNRLAYLGEPDVILCCGATNDSWAGSPIGEYKYANWTPADFKSFRPAMAALCEGFRTHYPQAKVYFILNSELKPEINESVRTICRHYGIALIELHDIDKQWGHPSVAGMKAIADQVLDVLRADGCVK